MIKIPNPDFPNIGIDENERLLLLIPESYYKEMPPHKGFKQTDFEICPMEMPNIDLEKYN